MTKQRPGKPKRRCDYPGCCSVDAKRVDIQTSWFRGDDVVLNICKDHRKPEFEAALMQTEKARKQL